jgi:hypothetical protein
MKALLISAYFVIYTVGYFFFAIDATGGGHGNAVFLAPLTTWPLLLIATVLLCMRITKMRSIVFVTLMSVHYIVACGLAIDYLSVSANYDDFLQAWARISVYLMAGISWYFLGQLGLWIGFFASLRRRLS